MYLKNLKSFCDYFTFGFLLSFSHAFIDCHDAFCSCDLVFQQRIQNTGTLKSKYVNSGIHTKDTVYYICHNLYIHPF